jgi:hypothetical protein
MGWPSAGADDSWGEQGHDLDVKFNREISHCGINSIEMLFDSEVGKVTQLSDTRTQENPTRPARSVALEFFEEFLDKPERLRRSEHVRVLAAFDKMVAKP